MLRPEQRSKLDDANDLYFYDAPRFVTHVDTSFIERLTNLYRDRLQPDSRILDLMSSWVSHLPEDISFEHVEGHGMNEAELAKNKRLDSYFVQNLNQNPKLSLKDANFDAVLITVSIQYLQYPEAVLSEIYRVLKPNGIVIISFSNRMFYQKAIAAWRDGTDTDRVNLVRKYFQSVDGFTQPEVIVHQPPVPGILQMLGLAGGDPFYAVVASKEG
ncbi:MAG: class I SAM-dependent methyltransferase [Cyanobacteria bacterium P01_G01_bin.39]